MAGRVIRTILAVALIGYAFVSGDSHGMVGIVAVGGWIGAVVGAVAAIGSAIVSKKSGDRQAAAQEVASELQGKSADEARELLKQWREELKADLQPYTQAALDALAQIEEATWDVNWEHEWWISDTILPVFEDYASQPLPTLGSGIAPERDWTPQEEAAAKQAWLEQNPSTPSVPLSSVQWTPEEQAEWAQLTPAEKAAETQAWSEQNQAAPERDWTPEERAAAKQAWLEENQAAFLEDYEPTEFAPGYRQAGAAPVFEGYDTELPEWERGREFEEALPDWEGYDTQLTEWDPNTVDLESDPGYQFRVEEGLKGIRRRGSAGSGFQGGATYKALERYGQDMASQEFAAARDRAVQDYQLGRGRELDLRGAEREQFETDRGEVFDRYGVARDDYDLGYGRARDERAGERYGYESRRSGWAANVDERRFAHGADVDQYRQDEDLRQYAYQTGRENRLTEYDADYRRAQDQRELDETRYGYARQEVLDERNIAVSDRSIREQQRARIQQDLDRQHQRLVDTLERGLAALLAGEGAGAEAELIRGGADARAAGRVGAANAKAQATQNAFNNMIQIAGIYTGLQDDDEE